MLRLETRRRFEDDDETSELVKTLEEIPASLSELEERLTDAGPRDYEYILRLLQLFDQGRLTLGYLGDLGDHPDNTPVEIDLKEE